MPFAGPDAAPAENDLPMTASAVHESFQAFENAIRNSLNDGTLVNKMKGFRKDVVSVPDIWDVSRLTMDI